MYLDPFSTPAYQLTGTVHTVYVGFAHFPDEDCVIKRGLCSVCVFTCQGPVLKRIMISVSLSLNSVVLSLLGHSPPVDFQRVKCNSLHCKSGLINGHICVLFLLFYLFLVIVFESAKNVNCVQILCIVDYFDYRVYIFYLLFILKWEIIYFSYINNVMSRSKASSLRIPYFLVGTWLTEAVLMG